MTFRPPPPRPTNIRLTPADFPVGSYVRYYYSTNDGRCRNSGDGKTEVYKVIAHSRKHKGTIYATSTTDGRRVELNIHHLEPAIPET